MKNNIPNTNTHSRRKLRPGSAAGWLCGLALLLAGCTDSFPDSPQEDPAAGGQVTVRFDLAPDVLTSIDVKAPGAVDENIVKDVWVIQLKSDGSGQVQAPQYITALTPGDGGYRAEVKLTVADSKVYFIANTHNNTLCNGIDTQAKLEALTMPTTGMSDLANGLPMSGSWAGSPGAMVGIVGRITLTRAVSKITFNLKLSPDMLPGEFLVLSYEIAGCPDRFNFFGELDFRTMNYIIYYKEENPNITIGADPQTFTFYVPEYLAGTSSGVSPLDKHDPCFPLNQNNDLIPPMRIAVQAVYSSPFYNQAVVNYFIYPGENNINDYNVRRNRHYTLDTTIKNIDEYDTRIQIEHIEEKRFLDYTNCGCPEVFFAASNAHFDVVRYSEAETLCTDGWRLPTRDEANWLSLFYDEMGITTDNSQPFWTSTSVENHPTQKIAILLSTGNTHNFEPNERAYVRCVRSSLN